MDKPVRVLLKQLTLLQGEKGVSFFIFLILLMQSIAASAVCKISSFQEQYKMDSCTQYYQGDLNPIHHSNLWLAQNQFQLQNYSTHSYWQKIHLINLQDDSIPIIWKEYLAKDILVHFYQYEDGKLTNHCSSGTSLAPKSRCMNIRYPTISFKIPPHTHFELYIEKQSTNPLQSRPTLLSPKAFQEIYMEGLFVGYHYFGISLAVLAINFLLWWIIRERIFASYVFFHICLVCTTLIITGFAEMYLGYWNWAKYLPLLILLTAGSYFLFCIHYFQISLRKYGKWIFGVACWPLLQFILHEIDPNIPAFDDQSFFFIVLGVLVLSIFFKGRGTRRKSFFIVAWSGYMVLLCCYLLFIANILPNHPIFKYGAYEAHIWEMIWFTVGFAKLTVDRIKNAQMISDELKAEKELILTRFSHELRTPLMGIIGAVESQQATKNEENQLIEISAHKLLAHVNNVILYMDYSQNQPIHVQQEWIDLKRVYQSWIKSLELRYRDKEIRIESVIKNLDDLELLLDPRLLSQTVMAILDNACKFSSEKVIFLLIMVMDSDLCIQVKNNGPVFTHEAWQNYFKGFQKGESFLRQKYGGLGLGLSLVNHIQNMYPFRFHVLDYPHGAHLEMRWTVERRNIHPIMDDFPPPTKVLIVDDNIINRKVLYKLVSKYPIDIEMAVDGLDAYQKWRKNKATLIFMDLQMPKLDGLEASRWIRKMEEKLKLPKTYIVAISAHVSPATEHECFLAGINEVCAKPVSKMQIRDWLKLSD